MNPNRIIKAVLPSAMADPMTMSMTHHALIRAFKFSITAEGCSPDLFFKISPTDEAKIRIVVKIANSK